VLAIPDRQGKVQPTPLFERLLEAAGDIRPKHIGIDATADTFAGNEIDRSQVRQFVGLMRKLAIAAGGSVVLLAHPSLTGISSGTGLSGSTAWHNSVRARMLLKSPSRDSNDDQSASDLRELSFLKNNYGPLAERIVLRYRNGLFLPEAGQSTLEKLARDQKVDETFLDVLGKLIKQNRPVSPSAHASNHGPKVIAGHPDGKAYTSAITGPRSNGCWRPTASISPASGHARKRSGTWRSDRPDRRECDGPSRLPSWLLPGSSRLGCSVFPVL
jgi:RecA-family ATPase